ncbi:TetR/AcrR family transcriptional regulator [Nocardia niwae]|uniref:TetR/AcrR family transcriptional regulator n=1 Tax=Nocardia niwae TaxID=626084 RepID=UPI0007A38A4A|nr:TetR/AcrR family transcriptional regulator [Nocardia niwae]
MAATDQPLDTGAPALGTKRGRRGEYAKSAARRRAIIAAAVEIFSESGFRDGSLRDVAERAGITHAGIRHHFPTKVDLLQAVLHSREEQSLTEHSRTQIDGIDAVNAWIEAVAENVANPTLVELEFVLAGEAASPDHPAHGYFVRMYSKSEGLLCRAFAIMQDRNQLRNGIDPALAARSLLAVTQGVQTVWLRDRRIDIADTLRAQLTVLCTPDSAP